MKKATMNGIVTIFLLVSLLCLLGSFIIDNKIFTQLLIISIGISFLFQSFINKDIISNNLSKMQLIVSVLMLSLGTFGLITILISN